MRLALQADNKLMRCNNKKSNNNNNSNSNNKKPTVCLSLPVFGRIRQTMRSHTVSASITFCLSFACTVFSAANFLRTIVEILLTLFLTYNMCSNLFDNCCLLLLLIALFFLCVASNCQLCCLQQHLPFSFVLLASCAPFIETSARFVVIIVSYGFEPLSHCLLMAFVQSELYLLVLVYCLRVCLLSLVIYVFYVMFSCYSIGSLRALSSGFVVK